MGYIGDAWWDWFASHRAIDDSGYNIGEVIRCFDSLGV